MIENWLHRDHPDEHENCARCGQPALGYARGWKGERLCHPNDPDKPDCYTITTRITADCTITVSRRSDRDIDP